MEDARLLSFGIQQHSFASLLLLQTHLIAQLKKWLYINKSRPILFLTSGGSCFKLLESIDAKLFQSNCTIGVLDERFSSDRLVNNFAQLAQTNFYKTAQKERVTFIDTLKKKDENLENLSSRFETGLKQWKEENPQGVVIALMGIGLDGHTAGIMPYPENMKLFQELFNSPHWVVGYDAGHKNEYPLRVTVTNTFLSQQVNYAVLYSADSTKNKIIEQIISSDKNIYMVPARIIHKMKQIVVYKLI